jgi:ArsR family transcriptional regulator
MARPSRAQQLQERSDDADTQTMVDIARVREARAALPSGAQTQGLAALFGALGDPTRLRIIAALERVELCVGDLAASVGISTSAASHQLRALRSLGLVRSRRDGRLMYYALDDDHVRTLYRQALDHVEHVEGDQR